MNRNAQRGLRIKEERKRLGLTQAKAATAAGVSREMFARYEAGAMPREDVLQAMSRAGFDVNLIKGPATTYPTSGQAMSVNTAEQVVHLHSSQEGLVWREVLEIVINELQRAGLFLPGDKVIRLTDLLMEYQKFGVTVDQDFVGKQIRLVV